MQKFELIYVDFPEELKNKKVLAIDNIRFINSNYLPSDVKDFINSITFLAFSSSSGDKTVAVLE